MTDNLTLRKYGLRVHLVNTHLASVRPWLHPQQTGSVNWQKVPASLWCECWFSVLTLYGQLTPGMKSTGLGVGVEMGFQPRVAVLSMINACCLLLRERREVYLGDQCVVKIKLTERSRSKPYLSENGHREQHSLLMTEVRQSSHSFRNEGQLCARPRVVVGVRLGVIPRSLRTWREMLPAHL